MSMRCAMAVAAIAAAGTCLFGGIAPRAMDVLPLGAVRPEGWLRLQLERQRDGLTGHAEELYDDIGNSDWLTGGRRGGQYDWERGPYYAKGLVALALVLDDETLKARAKRWIDALLASQRPNGDIGPKNDNWWANMVVLHYARDWAEATGDARVEPFLRRYFAYQSKRLVERPLMADSAWAACRGGDELEVVLWLYDRTKDESLLDFARLLSSQTSDWTTYYHDGGDGGWGSGYRSHVVNFMQGLKSPALKSRLTGDLRDRSAYRAAFAPDGWAMRMNGRVDRMVNATEPLSGRSASEGTELCATAERILSCRDVVSAIGDVTAADDMEVVAFNVLPATLGDDGKGMRYYLVLNQARCGVNHGFGFAHNGDGGAMTPGPDAGFGCCRSNFHFAWPKFVQSLWMRKAKGLAAVAYAPSTVTTDVATIRTSGVYPFGDDVRLDILKARGGTWPLFVRIPSWCRAADVKINGKSVAGAKAGEFLRIDRTWAAGDTVELSFPAAVAVERGINDSVAVRRGPLVYALKLAADVKSVPSKTIAKEDPKELRQAAFPAREYAAKERWNRVLVLNEGGALDSAMFEPATVSPADPFVHDATPCRMMAKAGFTDYAGWGTFSAAWGGGRPVEPPPSPVAQTRVRDVAPAELVPLGSTQVRITLLPWTDGRSSD